MSVTVNPENGDIIFSGFERKITMSIFVVVASTLGAALSLTEIIRFIQGR